MFLENHEIDELVRMADADGIYAMLEDNGDIDGMAYIEDKYFNKDSKKEEPKKVENAHFNVMGYTKDFYVDKKFMGSLRLDEPDREVFGYHGRRQETLDQDLTLKKGKRMKKGTIVITELQMICGRQK